MGKRPKQRRERDYSGVIAAIEHELQHGTGTHPHEDYEAAARAMESGDAWRLVVEIGQEMDKATREASRE